MHKSIVEFKEGKSWVLNGKDIVVNKIETISYNVELDVPEHKKLETINPSKSLHNIIKNTALLPNGVFLEVDSNRVMARISDIVYDPKSRTNTLIKTQWYIPKNEFNAKVYFLVVSGKIPENKFHVISKIS